MNEARIIDDLVAMRALYGAEHATNKLERIRAVAELVTQDASRLRQCHDALLFIAAHPDSAAVRRAAGAALAHVGGLAGQLVRTGKARERARLENSGIAGTDVSCVLSWLAMRWLAARFPEDVTADWAGDDELTAIDALLPVITDRVIQDGLQFAGMSTQDWLKTATGRRSALAWLLEQIDRMNAGDAVRERLFDSLDIPIRWRLSRRASITTSRFPARPIAYQRGDLIRRVDPDEWLDRPIAGIRILPRSQARAMIDLARETLAVRGRETDPVTYANEDEVTLARLERGIDVVLFGMTPDRRQPIESYFGFVAARNRVPIGYGGGWVFFDRCEIGVNIFDAFRGGESMLIFTQIMRVYRQVYGAARFTVDPYQFGAGNPEAIASGAYWFYDRLGFRPVKPRLRRLADEERERIASTRGYRSPARVLRRLAGGPIERSCHDADPAARTPDLPELGMAITRYVATHFDGDAAEARRDAEARLSRGLGRTEFKRLSPAARVAFESMCLALMVIPDVEQWPAARRRAALRVAALKGGKREWSYSSALARFTPLLKGWTIALARKWIQNSTTQSVP
jgi:hypothetical protein